MDEWVAVGLVATDFNEHHAHRCDDFLYSGANIAGTQWPAGLEITAGQRTMSGQFWVLTRQSLGLPHVLFGHLRF